jgi:hypothetical protein
MSEELEIMEGSGTDRRTFIKRSAVVGGMVWAAPAISTLGSRAFAQTGTPRNCVDISHLVVVLTIGGTTYKFKIDENGAVCEDGGGSPYCPNPPGWDTAVAGGCDLVEWNTTDPCCWSVTVKGTDAFSLVGFAAGAGGTDSESGQGFCLSNATVSNGGRKYTFCGGETKN